MRILPRRSVEETSATEQVDFKETSDGALCQT